MTEVLKYLLILIVSVLSVNVENAKGRECLYVYPDILPCTEYNVETPSHNSKNSCWDFSEKIVFCVNEQELKTDFLYIPSILFNKYTRANSAYISFPLPDQSIQIQFVNFYNGAEHGSPCLYASDNCTIGILERVV